MAFFGLIVNRRLISSGSTIPFFISNFDRLTLMAKACFNPEAALELWRNMDQLKSRKGENVRIFVHPPIKCQQD